MTRYIHKCPEINCYDFCAIERNAAIMFSGMLSASRSASLDDCVKWATELREKMKTVWKESEKCDEQS